jgi:hypothetical protein
MKKCKTCNNTKELKCFHKKKGGVLGVKSSCADCCKTIDAKYYSNPKHKNKRLERQSSEEYQLYIRSFRLKRKYGITLEDYNNMLKSQNNVCKTCGTSNPGANSDKYFNVDHCHKTGKIRGLLCGQCNIALGLVKDNISVLENLIKYLKDSDITSL